MSLGVVLTDVLSFFLPTLFAAWPVLLLAPFGWKERSVWSFSILWCLLALLRVILIFFPGTGIRVIPEPLSTVVFLASGVVIGAFAIALRRRRV